MKTTLLSREARLAVLSMFVLMAAPLFAQETPSNPESSEPPALPDFDAPLQLGGANQETEPVNTTSQAFPGFMGERNQGWTSRFAPDFNPAIALVMDTVMGASQSAEPATDGFDLRSVELNFASQIDPFGWAYLVTAFEKDQFSLEEAAFFMNHLPAQMSVRVGRFLSDFDKWNTLHEHDLNYVHQDGVRGAFLGGNLRMSGMELHQYLTIGEVPVRWSLGLGTDFRGQNVEGDGLPVAGHTQDFVSGNLANRSFSQYGCTLHCTAQQDFGANGFFQYGFAVFHTPEGLIDQIDSNLDGVVDAQLGRSQTTAVLDFTLRSVDAGQDTAQITTLQFWHNQRQTFFGNGPIYQIRNHQANGIWGFTMHNFSQYWAAGVMAAWWQSPTNTVGSDIFSAGDSGAQRAVFLTWNPSPFNRLRWQVGQEVAIGAAVPVWSVSVQWDIVLGAHSHPMDW